MLTFFKISIFMIALLVNPTNSTFGKLAVNFLTKPAQIRQEMNIVRQVAKNNIQRQEQFVRQAKQLERVQKVGKPLAEKAIQHGRNKPNIPVVNKHHFKVRDYEKGYIQKIETGDQQMNKLAQEMFESQKNLYELMAEKAALRRAAREEGMKRAQAEAKSNQPKIQNEGKPNQQKVEQKNQNELVKNDAQNKNELKIDNKDPIDLLVYNPTRTFNKETYHNFLEQSKKFDKFMQNQYPNFLVKPNMQDYQNFELMQKMSTNLQNTKIYENVMQNLFKNEKIDLQKIDQQRVSRVISKQDLEILKQKLPKDVSDLKDNQKTIKEFLKQKINLAQVVNGNKSVQKVQNKQQLPSVIKDEQKGVQNILDEPKSIQTINNEQTMPSVLNKEPNQIVTQKQENTSLIPKQNEQTSLQTIQKQNNGIIQIPNEFASLQTMPKQNTDIVPIIQGNKNLINIDPVNVSLPTIMSSQKDDIITQMLKQQNLKIYQQNMKNHALNQNNMGSLINPDTQAAINQIMNDQQYPSVTFPSQLTQKENESLEIMSLIKKGGLQGITSQPRSQIIQDLLGETNPIQHEIQKNEPMQKMLPNDLQYNSEEFRKLLLKHPSLMTTGNANYFYLYKQYMNKEQQQQDKTAQSSIDTSKQNDKEVNLYPNYFKDQIKENPEALSVQEFQKFTKKDHFDNMTEMKDTNFKPELKLPKRNLLPMQRGFLTTYQNPIFNVMMYHNLNLYRMDDSKLQAFKNLPKQAQEKIQTFEKDFNIYLQDEKPYMQLLDLPFYNLMLDLEEKCIEEFELKKCGHLTYELTEIYKNLKRDKRRNFDFIKKQIFNKVLMQDHEINDVFQSITQGNLLRDLINKFESMHGRLEYLLYDYRLK